MSRKFLKLIDDAKRKQNIETDKELSLALGYSKGVVHSWRRGTIPSVDTIVKLAGLAGVDEKTALIEILHQTSKTRDGKRVLNSLKKLLGSLL